MFNYFRKELDWGGRKLVLETGKIARQADGAVLVSYGETIVLCTAVGVKTAKPGQDFFPLTVNYQEKAFAAGKIPGGFFKREGRPSEAEVLKSRLIDRPIRPLFPEGFKNEVQIVATVLSHDMENDPDIIAMIGCSAALTLSGIPFFGPVAAASVGYQDGAYILNPTLTQAKTSQLQLVVAGTAEGVLMVEFGSPGAAGRRHAGRGDVRAYLVPAGHQRHHRTGRACREGALAAAGTLRGSRGAEDPARRAGPPAASPMPTRSSTRALATTRSMPPKRPPWRRSKAEGLDTEKAKAAFKDLEADVVRGAILRTGLRIDGRDTKTVRPIIAEVGILPRAHGSSLFTRGETQALCVATLGTGQDEQIVDALEGEYRSNFMLHYNFPPYSVGEAGRMGSPGRREIGHGKLAWRALRPMLPEKDKFPYTMRVVSEITESNGSSSMATVCGGSLALMDAGVPLKRPVAGIAMGLIKEDHGFAVLSDILGDEDHLGDMDFKVAGTEAGITSLQMDIKITSITPEIMQIALAQARDGRLHILGEMAKALTGARGDVAATAPRISIITVPKEKIREVIGTGGKVIREIVEQTKCKIDIDDDGTIKIAAVDASQAQAAIDWIRGLTAEPELGVIYSGKVVKTADFGAFVNFMGSRDGLVHISELKPERVAKTTDVVNIGDQVKVKVIGFDERGKIKLSMRVVDQQTGADITAQVGERPARGDRPERGDRPDRGDRGDRGFDRPRRERPAFQEGSDQPPVGD